MSETPLEALERFRIEAGISTHVPLTYAGRLDPMAEGLLLVLSDSDCKNKHAYTSLDKEYEIEVLLGVQTDTYDVLGLIQEVSIPNAEMCADIDVSKYAGRFVQEYPAYSSKTVGGAQLHTLAREGNLPDEMPTKPVEIYSIDRLGSAEVSGAQIAERAIEKVKKVKGDFRQEAIARGWQLFAAEHSADTFVVVQLRVFCSSGTYMRSLAHRIGEDCGVGALALSINRTKILTKDLVF